jgi:glycosyltransferase involved in cell wall biosynthesis
VAHPAGRRGRGADHRHRGAGAAPPGIRALRGCSPHCGIDPETTSGGETFERELLQRVAALGVHFDILLARHKRYPAGVANWTIHRLPIGRGLRWPVAPFVVPPAIKRVWDATPFDFLRVHSLRYIGPAALLARRRYRLDVPIVAHHHHLDPHWLNPLIEGRVMRAVERVVVGSEFAVRQAVAELGVPAERFAVVPYGVDARFAPGPRPAPLARRWGLEGRTVALFLGGLKARKNLFGLLDTWRLVAAERPDACLLVCGAGPLLEPLRRRAADLVEARRAIFTGYVPEREKVDYYNLADVLFFPSSLEGFGFSVAEAMSCGLPVVASNRGSLPELLADGEGGVLVDPDDRETAARRLAQLLADAPLRQKLGALNRERVEARFRWDRCARATKKIYEDVVDEWRRRRAPAR